MKFSMLSSQQNVPSFEEIQRMEEEKEKQARVMQHILILVTVDFSAVIQVYLHHVPLDS